MQLSDIVSFVRRVNKIDSYRPIFLTVFVGKVGLFLFLQNPPKKSFVIHNAVVLSYEINPHG